MILKPDDPPTVGGRSSAGPRTATVVAASRLSVGWGVVVIIGFWGPPDHVSALSSPGTWPGIRPVIHAYQQEGADRLGMVSRCVSAAGVRFLVILRPPTS